MAWKKNFTKIFTYRRSGRLSTPCLDGVDFAHAQTGYLKNFEKTLMASFSVTQF